MPKTQTAGSVSALHYTLESCYRGDPADAIGPRCQFRRYIVDVFLENGIASCGTLSLRHEAGILYFLGHVPIDGIRSDISGDITKQIIDGVQFINTRDVTISWESDLPVDAGCQRQKIARLMFYFCRWAMDYSHIQKHTAQQLLSADPETPATADHAAAAVSPNHFTGIIPLDPLRTDVPESHVENTGKLLSRFAVLADAHVGVGYQWENYDWLYGVFRHLENSHKESPLDFVVQIGDIINDGYVDSHQIDYDIYMQQIPHLSICDPAHPLEGRDEGKIPHYEMQGNHDPTPDTRFFRNKLWYTHHNGETVAYIGFWARYGGYPLVKHYVAGNYDSYRSYGVLLEETIDFVEKSVEEAAAKQVRHIVLMCHFGISQEVSAPILPESGLGRIAALCQKHGIKLFFNGHEHDPDFTHRMYRDVHDWDVSMLRHKYAIAEIYEHACKVHIYNTDGNTLFRTDTVDL